jgi:hypothetical protein
MSRTLLLLLLVATAACAPTPELLAPRVKSLRVPKTQPHVIAGLDAPRPAYPDAMPVAVPDTTRLEPMPVYRPDTTIDREMAIRGFGSVAMIRLRGPARVAPASAPDQPAHPHR